ncbi:ATP-binding protein [Paenibacillus mesophilus]|uniref:ATP-binding protein n=1 Tax=Paenibacillus mesophilus TaxID=2582849 RepID=UPI001EE4CAED|nr:ATP-binding protein [Paenibacillus mesophilus]
MSTEAHRSPRNEAHISQLASVGQIAAGIAHEVRNPLTAVKGFLQLLKERKEEHYIEVAQAELENAIGILQNLLNVSKPDLEDEPFESIDLTAELELLMQLFQDQFYRVELVKSFQDPGTYISGRKNQLKKAFFNLLKNAFEAIPGKGRIVVGHSASDGRVTVYIQDSGTGIPKQKMNMLGTPFFTTKQNGTGMGLTLVFSVIYQHNGFIQVESDEKTGTRFTITFPVAAHSKKYKEVVRLQLQSTEQMDLKQYFRTNRKAFEEQLLTEAVNVRDKIDEILRVGNINLLDNAYKLVIFIVEGREHEVISFAKTEGVTWAKHSLTLAFKLEWLQAVRRVLWSFLYNYDLMSGTISDKEHFFNLEKRINELMDLFVNHLFISYSQFKDDLIRAQREMMDDLSVPIIPFTPSISILPLIGTIDTERSLTIEDKVITQIGTAHIETLIIDLSGVLEVEPDVIRRLIGVIDGVRMMGCQCIITGFRPGFVKMMVRTGLTFENKAVTKATLQQALADVIFKSPPPGTVSPSVHS